MEYPVTPFVQLQSDAREVLDSRLEVRKVVESGARVLDTFEHWIDASTYFDNVLGVNRAWYTGAVLQIVRVDTVVDGSVVEYVMYRRSI